MRPSVVETKYHLPGKLLMTCTRVLNGSAETMLSPVVLGALRRRSCGSPSHATIPTTSAGVPPAGMPSTGTGGGATGGAARARPRWEDLPDGLSAARAVASQRVVTALPEAR